MDAAVRSKWIKALRSGKYYQAQGQLKSGTGSFCCLGVLCDIQGINLDAPKGLDARYGARCYPDEAHSAGLTTYNIHTLANKNDAGDTFTEIAKWIVKNIPSDATT